VFDLSCVCFWDEFALNIDPLIQLCAKQLACGELPLILPFHSLHYPMEKNTMKLISEAYAKDVEKRALRSLTFGMNNPPRSATGVETPEQQLMLAQYQAQQEKQEKQVKLGRLWREERLANDFPRYAAMGDEGKAMGGRLRIGYISSDFVNHPTADLIQSALLQHDKTKFEVFCYSITKDDNSEYRKTIERWVPGHYSTASKARRSLVGCPAIIFSASQRTHSLAVQTPRNL
jgi:hypothetical protein